MAPPQAGSVVPYQVQVGAPGRLCLDSVATKQDLSAISALRQHDFRFYIMDPDLMLTSRDSPLAWTTLSRAEKSDCMYRIAHHTRDGGKMMASSLSSIAGKSLAYRSTV
jgi:hypothetical protein